MAEFIGSDPGQSASVQRDSVQTDSVQTEHEVPTSADADADGAARGRLLFRYVTVEEWSDYRSIIGIFADTFFAEFSPEDVQSQLAANGVDLDEHTVGDRLESLRRWGNLTVSSSVGNPTSVADYYRRRNRYLITTSGQNVHQVVEGVLATVDEVRDVSTGRLRALRDGLVRLCEMDLDRATTQQLADAVSVVFDNHSAFTDEVAQFFAAINQWQSRYDLDPEEFRFFAEVLVSYVGDRLDEIERTSRPIGVTLDQLRESIPRIVEMLVDADDLASRVGHAGLDQSVSVTRRRGFRIADWDHMIEWFRPTQGVGSRIDRLGHDAVAAIRTLTTNLTRLSRIGVTASSRRADFLRLAKWFNDANDSVRCHQIAAAGFGLHAARHWGVLADDSADPVGPQTSWWTAPRAPVAVSLRERGDTASRGGTSPMPDQRQAREMIRLRRVEAAARRDMIDHELVQLGDPNGATLSVEALERLQQLLSAVRHLGANEEGWRQMYDGAISCAIRQSDRSTVINCPEGTLTLDQLEVSLAQWIGEDQA
ncbi:MAG: TIGR02677 family protein [Microthrixaceae bacterium]